MRRAVKKILRLQGLRGLFWSRMQGTAFINVIKLVSGLKNLTDFTSHCVLLGCTHTNTYMYVIFYFFIFFRVTRR